MFDPKALLDSFLGAKGGQNAGRDGGGGSPWGQLAGSLGSQGGGQGGAGGFLGDIAKNLGGPEGIKQGAGKAMDMARQNPLAAGAILAGVLGTGMGRGLAGNAIKLGGLAAIASMAYNAYQNHQAGKSPQDANAPAAAEPELLPPPQNDPFHPSAAPQGEDEWALTLIRAMIAAAKADGHIDDAERARIGDRVELAGLEGEAAQFLLDELDKPVNLDAIVSEAKTEAQRVELFTAARLAIDADNRAERGFLDQLAARLNLEDSLVEHIEATVASAKA